MRFNDLELLLLQQVIASAPPPGSGEDTGLCYVTSRDFQIVQGLVRAELPHEERAYQDFLIMLTIQAGNAERARESAQQRQRSKKRRKRAA